MSVNTETEEKLSKLKKGDKIEVVWFRKVRKARVIKNYPNKKLIYLRIRSGMIIPYMKLEEYHSCRFDLI